MNEKEKSNVDTNSVESGQGVEAGINSAEDTKNRKAGDESGRELKNEDQTKEPVHEVPLFLRGGSEGQKGNTQDEKDETGE
ncbi:MAG TPA: hypothetical protein VGC66_21165 [Pyrinomonadaceae bacterium]|jgi:hypothetical protein